MNQTIYGVIDYLNKTYGYNISTSYYHNIGTWLDWWKGKHKPFHEYNENGFNGRILKRDMYTMKMAKKICEDWASLILNEKTSIVIEDKKASEFIQGEDENGGVFKDNNFWVNANALVEKAFALGTGAFATRYDNGKIKIAYIDAGHIIPISYDNGEITEVAFVSGKTIKGKDYVYLEMHTLENGRYKITNRFFDENFKEVTNIYPDIVPEYDTRNNIPWFSIITPNIVNNVEPDNPLGVSVYANAIDNLKGLDLAYNNFCRDFKLGGKKVFLDNSMIQVDENGNTITPDDVAQQLFQMVGEGIVDNNSQTLVHEFNPSLRVSENSEAIQSQLNYLSTKCGFGERYYNFDTGGITTATQVISENSSMFRNIKKHEIIVEQSLIRLVRAILSMENYNPNVQISVKFDDSIIEDKTAERAQDRQDVSMGVMSLVEYRMKYYGEDESTAKKNLPSMNEIDGGDENAET